MNIDIRNNWRLTLLAIVIFSAVALAQDIQLSTVPSSVIKLADNGKLPTESWMFYVVVNDRKARSEMRPVEGKLDLLSGGVVVNSIIIPEQTISKMRWKTFTLPPDLPAHSLRRVYARDEIFDVRLDFPQVPIGFKVDKVRVTLRLALPDKTETSASIDVPVTAYQQKTTLIFPMVGPAIINQGMWNNGGHSGYGNQFALDVMGLTPNYAAMNNDSDELTAYATWGREVIAPADGTVVYSRNDVPDNGPNVSPESVYAKLDDPLQATAGNAVVISHGNSEYSVMMHMQKGSVRVTKNQAVKRGDVVGLIGCSGDCFGPHLHFQVQTGPELFRYPSVPVTFDNLKGTSLLRGVYFNPKKQ
jgi:hypothetical protein